MSRSVCVSLCVPAHECSAHGVQKRAPEFRFLGIGVVWVLGSELGSSARAQLTKKTK